MEFKSIVDKAKALAKEMKAKVPAERITEFRFLVQFGSGEVYQYRANAEGLAKLARASYEDIVTVQFAGGYLREINSKTKTFKKFTPSVIRLIEMRTEFIVPEGVSGLDVAAKDFGW